jgi:hypothetical protein
MLFDERVTPARSSKDSSLVSYRAVMGLTITVNPSQWVKWRFFDFISLGNSSLLLSIGDVSYKDSEICKSMHNLNRMVWQLAPDNFFATMFYARVTLPQVKCTM